jgi:hypothetical protein
MKPKTYHVSYSSKALLTNEVLQHFHYQNKMDPHIIRSLRTILRCMKEKRV